MLSKHRSRRVVDSVALLTLAYVAAQAAQGQTAAGEMVHSRY